MDGPALEILFKEYDALKDLYTQAEASAQNTFNFYLTLVTTVVGGIVLITQVAPVNPADLARTQLTMSALLVFAAMIGAMYLSSISGRYAHAARYAQGLDGLRQFLFTHYKVPLPRMYQAFIAVQEARPQSRWSLGLAWITWLLPTGTYQFFIAALNSAALALATWLFLTALQITTLFLGRSLLVALLVFALVFNIFNVYSRLMMRLLISRLNVRVDFQRDLPFVAGKQ
jgi:hypothetical protein